MNKKRLLKLADLLEADAKNKKGTKFDLSVIAAPAAAHLARFPKGAKVVVDCGTAACAVGLACISGAFSRSGLGYENSDSGFVPIFKDRDGRVHKDFWRAELRFFELSVSENEFLFCGWKYPKDKTTGAIGERLVAKRIRDFVAGKVQPSKD